MGKLIMWNVTTVDGYFEGAKSWDLSWHDLIWSEDLEAFSIEQLTAADALLFGRVTYEGMAAFWKTETGTIADYMNSLPKYVVSNTLKTAEWNNSKIIRSRMEDEIAKLKTSLKKDIYVFGSSKLVHSLISSGLMDEYRIGIAPHIHGAGNLLFKPGLPEQDLTLIRVQQVRNDGVIVTYQPKRAR
jgi:dihydrofolate reductase